jgi:hypothetical protein
LQKETKRHKSREAENWRSKEAKEQSRKTRKANREAGNKSQNKNKTEAKQPLNLKHKNK